MIKRYKCFVVTFLFSASLTASSPKHSSTFSKPLPSRAASSSSNQRRAIDSGERCLEQWNITRHSMSLKTRQDAEIRQAQVEIDLSDLQREEIMSMVDPAITLLKLKHDSIHPHVVVEDEEEA